MIFKCEKCNYQTKHKSHFNKHLNKLNPCSNEVVVFNKNSWEKYNGDENAVALGNPNLKSVEELNLLSKEQLVEIIKTLI